MNQDNDQTSFPVIPIHSYRRLKRRLQKMEKRNYNSIYLIPCSGNRNWYELAEHSALFYYYKVRQKLNLKTKFYADTMSLYDQYEIGFIRSRGIDRIRQDLKNAELYQSEKVENGIVRFLLTKTYNETIVAELYQLEINRRTKNLSIEKTGLLEPALHQILSTLSIHLHRLCNSNLDKLSSQVNGADIIRLSDGLLETYYQITAIEKASPEKIIPKLSDMRKNIYTLIIKIRVLSQIKLWELETCIGLTESLSEAREMVENHLRRLTKNNKKDENGTS